MNDYFCQGGIDDPGYDSFFKYHPLLKTHSNQEHDNAIHHLPLPDIIEQLFERIIHSVPV